MSKNRQAVDYRELKTSELIRQFLMSKIKTPNQKQNVLRQRTQELPQPPEGANINSIAIVLDGRVEEVIRCENRLAALLLSEPTFIEFDPETVAVKVGSTEYLDGQLYNVEESNE
jgi:hypothetical protein